MIPSFHFLSLRRFVPILALLISAGMASAATYSAGWNSGFAAGGNVPDGNAGGWSDSRVLVIPASETITDVNISISESGGWNGDLYAYVTHSNSPGVAVLFNRPGRDGAASLGYGDSLLTVTLDDEAGNGDLHFYQSATGYGTLISNGSSWQPDGRAVNPFSITGAEPRTAMLSVFDGMNASTGTWTLFVADLVSGDQATVASWGITVVTVPEPAGCILLLSGLLALLANRRRLL